MFYLGGVGLAVFLDLLLLAKRSKSRADWILAWWLLVIALHLSMFTFFRSNLYPELLGLDLPLPLFHGPFLYLYTRALTGRPVGARHLLIHLALPLAFYLYLIPFISLPAAEKIFVYENEGIGYETFLQIRAPLIPASGVVYILLSLFALRRHRRAIVEHFSSVDKVNLAWLQNLIIGLSVIWLLVLIGNDDWIFTATVIFTFFIGFFGIRQGVIYNTHLPVLHNVEQNNTPTETNPSINTEIGTAKYQKSGLTASNSEALHRRLTALMASERLFRNSEFSLADLAERLNVPPNHVSQVINEREGKNFYDFVNSLRIQEFLAIASAPDSRKLTLFGLAQQCGFNSKSSFNRHFKKITGQSPSEYMQDVMATQN
jgi:AraC-like DNA-binding protein